MFARLSGPSRSYDRHRPGKCPVGIKIGRVEPYCIIGLPQRRRFTRGIRGVACLQIVGHILQGHVGATRAQLAKPSFGPRGDARGDKKFGVRIWKNHRSDIAPVEYAALRPSEMTLKRQQRGPHPRD